jgi:hypothetical protein
MAVRDIAHVELYSGNKQSVTDYLVSTMGFERMGDAVEVDRSSALLRLGDVRLRVTQGPATWKFLDAYGDGVADITVTCDDVEETRDAALADGAHLVGLLRGRPVVSGHGSVTHTLLPHSDGHRIRLQDCADVFLAERVFGEYAGLYRDAFGVCRSPGGHRAEDPPLDSAVPAGLCDGAGRAALRLVHGLAERARGVLVRTPRGAARHDRVDAG